MWNTRDAHLPQVKWGSIKGVHTHTKNVKKTSSCYVPQCAICFPGYQQHLHCSGYVWHTCNGLWLDRPWDDSQGPDGRVSIISYYISVCSRHLLHVFLVSRLIPGKKYYYIFGDSSYGWSDEYSFKAAPTPGPTVTTRILAVGGSNIKCYLRFMHVESWSNHLGRYGSRGFWRHSAGVEVRATLHRNHKTSH